MTDLLVREYVEVPTPACVERLISDSELAAMRPSPRRAPDLVARRAKELRLAPHPEPTTAHYPAWPVLITVGLQVSGLVAVVVAR